MDYAHGTGHGVGNYLAIHEGPSLAREPTPMSTVALEPGMIVTNEPAYYAPGDFGLRIESHMVVESHHGMRRRLPGSERSCERSRELASARARELSAAVSRDSRANNSRCAYGGHGGPRAHSMNA
jgi:Xaa-Pro aminopeptidase